MKWMVSKTRLGVACALVTLFGAGFVVQAADPSGRPAASGLVQARERHRGVGGRRGGDAHVRGGGIGKEQTFTVAPDARGDIRALKRGDEVVLALGAAGNGRGGGDLGGAVAGHEAIASIDGTRRRSSERHSGARPRRHLSPRPHLPLRPCPLPPFPRRAEEKRSRTSWGRFAIPASIPISIRAWIRIATHA